MNILAGFLLGKIVAGGFSHPVLCERFPRAVRTRIPWSVRSSRASQRNISEEERCIASVGARKAVIGVNRFRDEGPMTIN